MKELIWTRATKMWLLGLFIGLCLGAFWGASINANRVFKDCRYAGVVRIGEATFKCEQFSRVILLTPDEQAKK